LSQEERLGKSRDRDVILGDAIELYVFKDPVEEIHPDYRQRGCAFGTSHTHEANRNGMEWMVEGGSRRRHNGSAGVELRRWRVLITGKQRPRRRPC
jgi:hypothetical protein